MWVFVDSHAVDLARAGRDHVGQFLCSSACHGDQVDIARAGVDLGDAVKIRIVCAVSGMRRRRSAPADRGDHGGSLQSWCDQAHARGGSRFSNLVSATQHTSEGQSCASSSSRRWMGHRRQHRRGGGRRAQLRLGRTVRRRRHRRSVPEQHHGLHRLGGRVNPRHHRLRPSPRATGPTPPTRARTARSSTASPSSSPRRSWTRPPGATAPGSTRSARPGAAACAAGSPPGTAPTSATWPASCAASTPTARRSGGRLSAPAGRAFLRVPRPASPSSVPASPVLRPRVPSEVRTAYARAARQL